jgi:hypothetical protein
MECEENISIACEAMHSTLLVHRLWEEEQREADLHRREREAGRREAERHHYLRLMDSNLSSEELIASIWTNNVKQGPSLVEDSFFSSDQTPSLRTRGGGGGGNIGGANPNLSSSIHLDGLQQSKTVLRSSSSSSSGGAAAVGTGIYAGTRKYSQPPPAGTAPPHPSLLEAGSPLKRLNNYTYENSNANTNAIANTNTNSNNNMKKTTLSPLDEKSMCL